MNAFEMVVYSNELVPLGDLSEYEELNVERNYYKPSKLVMRVKRSPHTIELMKLNNIITNTADTSYGYTIQHVAYITEDNGQIIEVYAYSLNWFLSFGTLERQNRFSGNIETVVKSMIFYNLIDPVNPNRGFPFLTLGADQGIPINISSSKTGGDLCENSFDILRPYDCSIDVLINHTTKLFEVYTWQGADRSISQTINPHVIFSQEFDNILRQQYFKSSLDYKNVAVVAGEGEGIDRTVVIVNDNISGYDRRELYVDARDIRREYDDENGNPVVLTDTQYAEELTRRGIEKLATQTEIESFESTIEDVQFKLNVDYSLGDKVTFQDKELNVILNARVTSIKTKANKNGIVRQPSFGTGIPTTN